MKINSQSKIIQVFGLIVLLLMVEGSHAASVDVGGWTFATDLEGWRLGDNLTTEAYNSSSLDWRHPCDLNQVTGTWKGGMTFTPVVYPAYPSASKGNENYGILSAKVSAIYVVKIPEDLTQQSLNKILTDATRIPTMCVEWDSEKDITFKGHLAHLAEKNGDHLDIGTISVLLDNDTVGVIEVNVDKIYLRNGAVFEGSVRDVINSITIYAGTNEHLAAMHCYSRPKSWGLVNLCPYSSEFR